MRTLAQAALMRGELQPDRVGNDAKEQENPRAGKNKCDVYCTHYRLRLVCGKQCNATFNRLMVLTEYGPLLAGS